MNILILVTALFLGTSIIKAEEKSPILPRKANNGEYTLNEAKNFASGDGSVAVWFRTNLLMLVNRGLMASGQNLNLDEANIHWIFEKISFDFKDLGPYTNSRLSDGIPEWFMDKDGWSGNVAVFRYVTCTIILYKTQCMNLLDIPVVPAKVKLPAVFKQPDVVDTVHAGSVTVVNNIYNNNTNTNTATATTTTPTSTGRTRFVVEDEEDNGFTRQVGWYPQQQMQMPQLRQNFLHLGLNFQGGGRQQQVQSPPRGYMGGGRSGVGNGQGYMGGGNPNGNNNGNQGGGRGN